MLVTEKVLKNRASQAISLANSPVFWYNKFRV